MNEFVSLNSNDQVNYFNIGHLGIYFCADFTPSLSIINLILVE